MKKISLFFLICAMALIGATKLQAQNVCTVYDNNGTELISYDNLGAAFNFAVNNPGLPMHIVMTADYTLTEGNYTLPANASLLIPHKDGQKKPYGEDPWRISVFETPSVFRTLTFADGVNLVVKGTLEISAQQFVASTATEGTGRVAGAYGVLSVADGCNVWLDNGSKLCAWGYMKGNGNVQAKRGATVYEMFQVYDWKGGTNITSHFLDKNEHHGTFPFNQYFIQNIEMPVTYQPGSQLLTSFGITAYSEIYAVNNIGIIGTYNEGIKSMFEMDNDADDAGVWVRKSYNAKDDRQVYEINNAAYINAISINAMGFTFSSDEYQLPITNNMDIHLLSGRMRITQDVTMLPSSRIEIDKESTVSVDPNKSVYLYDLDQWADYAYSNKYAKMVWYSPSWTNGCPRDNNPKNGIIDLAELTDASINIHGILEMHGNIFTTTDDNKTVGGANIYSTDADAGTIQFEEDYITLENSAVYQWKQTTFPQGEFYPATAPSAWLKNGNNTFVKTSGLSTKDLSLCYISDAWRQMTTIGCFVYDKVNKKWFIKPAEYVEITVTELDEEGNPKENSDHLYTDAATQQRLFLLDANSQWWEVTKDDEHDAYYWQDKDGNKRYYRYNVDDEIWEEAKVKVTFDPANEQSSVDYNVKLGTVPQYMGDDPVKEQDGDGSYTFKGWKSENDPKIYKFDPMPAVWDPITYVAQYSTITRLYLITFANANNGANVGKEFALNATPSYGATPTKANDNMATDYQFTGWKGEDEQEYGKDINLPAVTGRATYTAQFTGTPCKYTIIWLDNNGTEIKRDEDVNAGTNITPPEDPVAPDGFNFIGWRNLTTGVFIGKFEISQHIVTGNTTYQAVLDESGKHCITFMDEDGKVLSTQYVTRNEEYKYEGETPTKEGYEFIGWSPTFYTRAIATENAVYIAHFRDASGYDVVEVTTKSGTTLYQDFTTALNAICAASGNVSVKMLKSVEYQQNKALTIQNSTKLIWDFNGCEVNLTAPAWGFLTMQQKDTLIIRDSSPYQGGRFVSASEGHSIFKYSDKTPSSGQIIMESGAILSQQSPSFELRGNGTSLIMNGGYVETDGAAAYPICYIFNQDQSVEFNGGKWFFNNTGNSPTYAMSSGSSSSYSSQDFHFTMNGGEIELKGNNPVRIFSSDSRVYIEINNGRLSASSTGGEVTMFHTSTYNPGYSSQETRSTIYINNGELYAKTEASSKVARITDKNFIGEISGGKFKVSAPTEANQYYFNDLYANSIKGGYYNIVDTKLSGGIHDNFRKETLSESDPEYDEGYRYQVKQYKMAVIFNTGETTLHTDYIEIGKTLKRYNLQYGGTTTWYKDKACTEGQEWNFATDIMPDHDLTLYCKSSFAVQVTIDGQSQMTTFENAFSWLVEGKICTIKLLENGIAVSQTVDKSVTLDLNGHTLTSKDENSLFTVNTGKTLTITDNTTGKNGAITKTAGTSLFNNFGNVNILYGKFKIPTGAKFASKNTISIAGGYYNGEYIKQYVEDEDDVTELSEDNPLYDEGYRYLVTPEVYLIMGGATTGMSFEEAIDIVADEEAPDATIQLLKDVSYYSNGPGFYHDLTLDLNGKQLVFEDGSSYFEIDGATFTLTDNSAKQTGKIIATDITPLFSFNGDNGLLIMRGGKVTIDAGYFCQTDYDECSVTIDGGSIIMENAQGGYFFSSISENSTLTINGGTIKMTNKKDNDPATLFTGDGEVTITGGKFNIPDNIIFNESGCPMEISGGYYVSDTYLEDDYIKEDFVVSQLDDPDLLSAGYNVGVAIENPDVRLIMGGIDNKLKLEDAIEKVNNYEGNLPATIQLLTAVSYSGSNTFTPKNNMTFDLNGKSLTCNEGTLFIVNTGKTLTITDNTTGKNGAITKTAGTLFDGSGKVNITDGKFKLTGATFKSSGIICSVSGGYYDDDYVANSIVVGKALAELDKNDPLYADGYRYLVLTPTPDLTINGKVELENYTTVSGTLTITKTGKLTVPAGKAITTNNFIIEGTDTESGELINVGTVTVNGNAYFDLTLNATAWTGSEWYSFAVPFEVDATSGISYEDAPLTLGTDIDILYYDGATRAANGADKSAWKYVEDDGDKTLVPGKLYMAAFLADKPNAVRFAKKSGSDLIFSGELNLSAYSATSTTDAGWNAIANPTLHHATLTATDITEGQTYVNGEDRYNVVTLASNELVVGRPVMIQTNADKPVIINTPAKSPLRNLMANSSSSYSVALSQDGKMTDRVIVATNDYAIDEYTIGQDLAKAGVSTKVAQMWVDRYNTQLCKNTVAIENNMADYPLVITAPQAGEYTIALEQTSTDDNIFLTENGSITWELSAAPATLNLSQGTDTTYGLRLVRKGGDSVTGNDNLHMHNYATKVIVNGHLFIIRDGKVYNAHGHAIK